MRLSIGQVSKIFNISKETLRYYDNIGILTPEVNESNGYRSYLFKHLEKLGLILGIKCLGISLSDIRSTIESEEISEYKKLVEREEQILNIKKKELKTVEDNLVKAKNILDLITNFDNEYDFSKLNINEENYELYSFDIKNILNLDFNKNNGVTAEEIVNLNHDAYFYVYNVLENKEVEEDENIISLKVNEDNRSLINKYLEKYKLKSRIKSINGKFVSTNFYGTIKEIKDYIISINKYFASSHNNVAYVKYDFYLPKKNEEVMYFVNISMEI